MLIFSYHSLNFRSNFNILEYFRRQLMEQSM